MHPLPTPVRRLVAGVVALVATAGLAGPAQAAPTAVERSNDTALNFTMPAQELALNFALPGQELALNFSRKAGG